MPRIRTLKPEIVDDEKTAALSDSAFRLFISLIILADDYGNTRGEDWWLRSRVWGARRESPRIAETLREIALAELVMVYTVREQTYLHLCGWEKHQRVDNRGKQVIPDHKDPESQIVDLLAATRGDSPRNSAKFRSDLGPRTYDLGSGIIGASPVGDRAEPATELPAHKPVVEAFHAYYQATHDGSKPTWGAKQVAQIKRLVKAHGADEVIRRIGLLGQSPPNWPAAPWDLATFVQHFDKLGVVQARSGQVRSFFDVIDALPEPTQAKPPHAEVLS